MTYTQTLDWMFAQLPMYQQKGKEAYRSKLDGVLLFSEHLGHPEKEFKSIHVAGTNGKGSSSHMLASVLQEAGYKVGLYTSPHLKDFRERIRINGKVVSQEFVVNFIKAHKDFLELSGLSFFEMTVGMAFQYFSVEKVDIAIIEVGLGGRLDSTNIIVPEVSLITNIGWDHTDLLGDSLEKIAYEKAGIIKEGVPVVISEYQSSVAHVFREVAMKEQAPIYFADQLDLPEYKTSLLGQYQSHNVKGVVCTLHVLKHFKIEEKDIRSGLLKVQENTGLQGRWHYMDYHPTIICDTGHNKDGLKVVLEQLADQKFEKLHIVLGFVKNKDLNEILPMFPKNATYYFSKPNIDRGLEVEELLEQAHKHGLKGKAYPTIEKALQDAKNNATKRDLIFIGGSNFVVAEVV